MRQLAMFLLGLLFAALVAAGCGEDESADQPAQAQDRIASIDEQQDAAQQDRRTEPREQVDQQDQAEQAADASEQEQQPSEQQAGRRSEQDEPAQPEPDQTEEVEQVQQQVTPQEQTKVVLGEDRPATLLLPKGADRAQPRPLIVLLHGYGSHAAEADAYFRFSIEVDEGGFGLLLPNGTLNADAARFWNGTSECCDIFGAETDDVGYIKSMIEEARSIASFDQVFAVGHSNGGFMAYRLACEEVAGLTAIISLAGGAHSDGAECRVPTPLSVLQIHGTEDALVLYEGGRLPVHPDPDRKPVPSAKESVLRWAERAGCDIDSAGKRPLIDTDVAVDGRETSVVRFWDGCVDETVMELWTINGGGHIPLVWNTDFTPGILKWLAAIYEPDSVESGSSNRGISSHTIGGERSAQLLLPEGREGESLPLILSLHGYQGEAEAHDWYFGLSERILGYNFALITPQGTADERGYSFWNATDACCNFHGGEIDDNGWLTGLVAEAREIIDVAGVYVIGYSNGGFMSYRLACDGLDGLVAIASLAGSSFGDPERCADATPVSVLQIHGTEDIDIPYAGTLERDGGYPGAVELVTRWAERAGCQTQSASQLPSIDLESTIDGADTSVQRVRGGCADGITVELWTIEGADHFPLFHDTWPDHLLDWLLNESRTN